MLIKLFSRIMPQVCTASENLFLHKPQCFYIKRVLINSRLYCDKRDKKSKALTTQKFFDNIDDKTKESYLDMLHIFTERDVHRRGHVEFIYSALKHMENFGVHKDLEVYKSLIDVLPKGKFIPTNIFQAEFMHYPKQQQCAIDLLQQMEDNGVIPDFEMEDMLINIFGRRGYPLRKYWRMMYWMPKFKNLSPFPLPNTLPNDSLSLAKLAITRIMGVDLHSEITVYQSKDIKDSVDDTWIVNGQSPVQRELLEKHDKKEPIYVEGAFKIWLKNVTVNYFVLKTDLKPPSKIEQPDEDDVSSIQVPLFGIGSPPKQKVLVLPSIHEQEEGYIFAVCATGTSSKDSLLSWIRHLEKNGNPTLGTTPVVFKLKSSVIDNEGEEEQKRIEEKKKEIEDK